MQGGTIVTLRAILLGAVVLVGVVGRPPDTGATPGVTSMMPTHGDRARLEALPQVVEARADLADRLTISPDQIEVVEVRAVTWPDTSMGCPAPGMAYLQVPQDGLLTRLRAGGQAYDYHSGGTRGPFLCERRGAAPKRKPGL